MNRTKHLPLLVFLLLSLIWSSTWIAIKVGLQTLPPFLAAGWRFLIASVILFVYMKIRRIPFSRRLKDHLFFIAFGLVLFTGGYAFVYWGQQYVASGMASVLFSVMPFYVLMLSLWLLPQEKINWLKVLGVLLGFAGIVVIFREQLNFEAVNEFRIIGMISILTGPFFSALGTIMGKKAGRRYHPIVLNVLPMFYAALSFFLLSCLLEQGMPAVFDFPAVVSITYLAFFGTAVAFVLYFWMIARQSVILMSMITFVTPPIALILGWLFLGEGITPHLIVGLIMILSGIFLTRK